jgi:hypothetical protein
MHGSLKSITVRKPKRDAGPKHKGDGKFRHPHRYCRGAQSMLLTDFSDRSTWMMKISVTLLFWSCVTLGFFNSVSVLPFTPKCLQLIPGCIWGWFSPSDSG